MASAEFCQFQSQGGLLPPHDFTQPGTLERYRQELQMNSLSGGVLPEGITVTDETVAGVPCSWIRFADAKPGKLIIQIHGGGFIGGMPCTKQWATIDVGRRCRADILSIDYRLAPEHPYPAAREDCVSVYGELLKRGYHPEDVVFFGESAGANLCLSTVLYARDHQMPVPAALAVVSPPGDLAKTCAERKRYRSNDPVIDEIDYCMSSYIADNDKSDSYLSPVHADFTGMPPILFQYGSAEALSEDGGELVCKAAAGNVDVTAHFHKDMIHDFYLMEGAFPEADSAVEELVSFILSKL